MKKHDNNTRRKGFLRKLAALYINGMTKYLFPDADAEADPEKGNEKPKFKNDRDRIFFK